MANNKYPWFPHDHNARNDEFLKTAEDRFGHFGYSAWFKIIEVIHEHGSCGKVRMTKAHLCQNLRSRWPQVRQYLDFCQTSGKLAYHEVGLEVELENKKLMKYLNNLRSKDIDKCLSTASKSTLEESRVEKSINVVTSFEASNNKTFVDKMLRYLSWEKRLPFRKPYKDPRVR